ncbi:V-snare-domain-containing protein [Basidiobolus meristosporus CBS 931.73]|uniref:V-snare-domain-containing protein n=1 Tax=Basidiobolus meristosporus CBS 931.73 TaxID=1314790 RepID=A0A1Y1X392_9FUNG|nr:V-snare-domain-containing protein [Basidiobolus meristosporus CBS 931.73]|eukprot:ORX80280.1 V-snare-domain-containing protein [Basidiobolus meristosporus CBS 931.73]
MSGVSELFDSYEQEYLVLRNSLGVKIDTQLPTLRGEERKALGRASERELEEIDEIVKQMEIELHNLPQTLRSRLHGKMRTYKAEITQLKKQFVCRSGVVSDSGERDELLGDHTVLALDSASMDQRSRLLSGTDRLQDSSRRLQDSHRLALETESLGVGILSDLRSQREQIQHTRDTLFEADSSIDRATRTLKSMTRRYAA